MRGIYLVTDTELTKEKGLKQVVEAAVQGGVTTVQLRDKYMDDDQFADIAIELKNLLEPYNVPLIINDRVELAATIEADGVHIGQSDMPFEDARKLLPPKTILGLSVENWEDVEKAQDLEVDYLGISPVFSTPTKTDTQKPWGIEGIKKIRQFSRHPLVAIGGINASNAKQILSAGADSIAVVSAICSAINPELAAKELKSIYDSVYQII